MFTPEEIKIANSTSRNSSAIGMKAITPKYVAEIATESDIILDFGAGKDAAHTKVLKEQGFLVVPYDFGENEHEIVNGHALDGQYDIVFASNVINVQQNEAMLVQTLTQIFEAVEEDGVAIMNYPLSPRKLDYSASDMYDLLVQYFTEVERVGGTKQAPLWECLK